MSHKSDDQVGQAVENAKEWVASKSGQQELQRLFQSTEEAKQELSEATRVDVDSLTRPVTL